MQYDYSNLTNAIYYVLTLEPDKLFTKNELLEKIIKEDACVELNEQIKYPYFYKYYEECLNKVTSDYKDITVNNNIYVYNLNNKPKYNMKQIEDIIDNTNKHPEIKFDTLYENGQTLLHILCIENRPDLLEKIGSSFNINYFAKNESNQTLWDVISIKSDISSQLLFKSLVKLMANQMREIKDSGVSEIKTKNTLLQEKNNELYIKNNILVQETKKYKWYIAGLFNLAVYYFIYVNFFRNLT